MPSRLWITLNVRVRPVDRARIYEDDLETALRHWVPGVSVSGGGTLAAADGEPLVCDVDFEIDDGADASRVMRMAIVMLEASQVGRGSRARLDDGEPVPFGTAEGLAIYLNGTDLPGEVYQSDPNDLVAALREALGAEGRVHSHSHWPGPRETAIYLYGPSAERMRALTGDVLGRFPLAQHCRVVTLPTVLPS